jgi:hypothetical protein
MFRKVARISELATANDVSTSLVLSILIIEAIISSGTSVLTRAT